MEPKQIKLYSIAQVSTAAFLGGPVAVIYILHSNYMALNKVNEAKAIIFWGSVITTLFIFIVPFDTSEYLSDNIFGKLVSVICVFIAALLSRGQPVRKSDISESESFNFQSNWRVMFTIVISVVIVIACILLVALGYEQMGYISFDE